MSMKSFCLVISSFNSGITDESITINDRIIQSPLAQTFCPHNQCLNLRDFRSTSFVVKFGYVL